MRRMNNYPYVITISSEKGGVGKTTLATNLAIFLKALDEELPVSLFSFDNHFTIDRMFGIKGQKSNGSVADLLLETPGRDLLHTGQYGVNFIPSSPDLGDLKDAVKGPMVLARLLAKSGIPGILIIDTRPDLDTLTQNALYAADRVLIPVKDMPSLENCKNIFALFDKRGMDRKSLSLIPCLIDERIKFDGLFADQKSLLKAFAINRGYRCQENFISKSPKVESLNTNPDGKIYPILTHGRGTDVYGQFFQLARTFLEEYRATSEPRALLFHQWLTAEDERKKESFYARLNGISQECLFCRTPFNHEAGVTAGFYYETSDGAANGFVEENCFLRFLTNTIYNLGETLADDDPSLLLLKESARESSFAFRPMHNGSGPSVIVSRFDQGGVQLLQREYPLKDYLGGFFNEDRKPPLYTLMKDTMGGYDGSFRDGFLLVHPVKSSAPEKILQDDNYRAFTRLKGQVAAQLT
nr:ParA family protein [Geobacter argillaceus]